MHSSRSPIAKLLAGAAIILTLAGCESIFSLDGNPKLCRRQPSNESVTNELVIVRAIQTPGPYERLVLDRVRYLAPGDERYLNRVIFATTEKVRPEGQGLGGVERGDTLRVSTTYASLVRGGGYEAYISNWAAREGKCWDGAWVSLHTLDSFTRSAH
jgi:hypothetical protein